MAAMSTTSVRFAAVTNIMSCHRRHVPAAALTHRYWPIREYQWGRCEAFNRQHSDCSILKRLLLEEAFHGR